MADTQTSPPVDEVDGGRLMAHCREFARRVKLSGTPEELESFGYIQGRLDGIGYRTTLLSHDAYISLPGPARVTVDGAEVTAITHSFSRPSPPGGLAARVVYLGEGGEAEFAREDVAGAIVLVEGIASPGVAARAAAGGAAGQLHISPHEHLHEMCISPVWGSPSATKRRPALPQNRRPAPISARRRPARCARRLAADRGAAGGAARGGRQRLAQDADPGGRAGTGRGRRPDAPFILFSGHHDTWYFGVMDNGSANATMIECARVLARHREAWRRGLRLCFWSGHSHGRYSGSSWYADNSWDELERRCAVHVNVDSTGGVGATVLTENGTASELAGLAADSVRAETNTEHEGRRGSRSSDMSFWGVGVPSMFGSLSHQPPSPVRMRNPLGWWWHTPHDLLDKVDEANLVRDTRVFVRALWRLLTDAVLPLDYGRHAAALSRELAAIEARLDGRMSLAPLLEQAAALRAAAAGEHSDHALMAASRALVPLDYTTGDRFRHDPALPQAPWPVLDPIRALASAASGEGQVRFATVDAVRARNRMAHALRQAVTALSGA